MNEIPLHADEANITRQPVLRYTNGGKAVTPLGLAINSRRFNRTSQHRDAEPTTFLDATIWVGGARRGEPERRRFSDRERAAGDPHLDAEDGKNAGEEQRRPEDLQPGP